MRILALLLSITLHNLCFAQNIEKTQNIKNISKKIFPKDILNSVEKYYPEILQAKENILYSQASIINAEGEYDAYFNQNIYNRSRGFYDGESYESLVVKPFQTFNTELYGGYRLGRGAFPIYEDKLRTTDDGEYVFGIKTSLLKDREIDKNRAKILERIIKKTISKAELNQVRLHVKYNAMRHYYDWLNKGQKLKLMKKIYNNNLSQQNALKKRLKKGDISEIELVEAKQLVLKRKIDLDNLKTGFKIASNKLALFLRDSKNNMLKPSLNSMPKLRLNKYNKDINKIKSKLSNRPEINIIKQKMEIEKNNIKLGKNQLLPKADLNLEFANDTGSGSISRNEEELLVKVNLSIPIQTRKGDSSIEMAKSRIRQLKQKLKLTEDKLLIEAKNILNNLENLNNIYDLTKKQLTIESKLYQAEKKKFKAGQSNLFMVNQRENNLAQAKIKKINISFMINTLKNELNNITMNFDN